MDNYLQQDQERPAIQLKTNRGLFKFIIFSILTLGIYAVVYFTGIGNAVNTCARNHDGKKTMHFCLLFFIVGPLTFEIGTLVWFHKVSERIGDELNRRNIGYSFGAGTFWLWNLLGLLIFVGPFVYIYKLSKAVNLLCENYNNGGTHNSTNRQNDIPATGTEQKMGYNTVSSTPKLVSPYETGVSKTRASSYGNKDTVAGGKPAFDSTNIELLPDEPDTESDEKAVAVSAGEELSEHLLSEKEENTPHKTESGKDMSRQTVTEVRLQGNENSTFNENTERKIIELLKEYKALLDEEIITKEEYEQKKKQLLGI